jgi:hypothetical protein
MRKFGLKRSLIGLALVAGIALVPAVTSLAGFSPADRPTFTWDNTASYVTFNSITNNPSVGDERPFLSGKVNSAPGNVVDNIHVNDNDEVVLRVYLHNNAASNLNLVSTNTRVKILLPKAASAATYAAGYITSDNANPRVVADTVDFNGDRPFTVEYLPGTAYLTNKIFTSGTLISDSVVSDSGALVGYNALDGRVPGCFEYSGYVTIRVRVHMQPQVVPAYSCNLLNLTVNPGRKVDANVTYTATNGATLKTVTFDWGDGTAPLLTSSTAASHTFAKDGNYTVKSTLVFSVNGVDQSTFCTKPVSFNTPPTTPPVVGKPLPNTGPGSTVAIFAGVSAIAGAAHYFVTRRVRG